ncbi:MAG: hypothetical protein ABIA37_02410 [Candidatus Woesearchaeota archaeon]
MVSRKQKNQMTQFIADRLDESGLYHIIEQSHQHLLVEQSDEFFEDPKEIYVVAHNHKRTKNELESILGQNDSQGVYTAHLFYKNYELFFVRMVDVDPSWRSDKSLKLYIDQQINQMLHLRALEKLVLKRGAGVSTELAYYQSQSTHLPECIQIFNLPQVTLDRSHISVLIIPVIFMLNKKRSLKIIILQRKLNGLNRQPSLNYGTAALRNMQ